MNSEATTEYTNNLNSEDNGLHKRINKARILIVDDEPVNIKLLEKMLGTEGYINISSLSDPRQVKSTYESDKFDIVLLDINMPHLDGFDILERLNNIPTESFIPVLILTAQCALDTGTEDPEFRLAVGNARFVDRHTALADERHIQVAIRVDVLSGERLAVVGT